MHVIRIEAPVFDYTQREGDSQANTHFSYLGAVEILLQSCSTHDRTESKDSVLLSTRVIFHLVVTRIRTLVA